MTLTEQLCDRLCCLDTMLCLRLLQCTWGTGTLASTL